MTPHSPRRKKNEIKTTRFSSKHDYDQNSTIATKEWFWGHPNFPEKGRRKHAKIKLRDSKVREQRRVRTYGANCSWSTWWYVMHISISFVICSRVLTFSFGVKWVLHLKFAPLICRVFCLLCIKEKWMIGIARSLKLYWIWKLQD
jgi:hypothetical protein